MNDRYLGRLLLLVWLVLVLGGCTPAVSGQRTLPQAVNGVLDLRGWNFDQDGPLNLNGEWEFYWEQLLTSREFADSTPAITGLIHVPDTWRGYLVNGQSVDGNGYATFRLTVYIDTATLPEKLLALKMPVSVNSAHRLFVDGQLLGSAGQVGPSAETMTAQHRPYIAVFAPAGDSVEILLQISSFYQYQGGIAEPVVLGTQRQIQQNNEKQLGSNFFLMGSVFIIGLYHLMLFLLRRRDRSPLYLGLFCLLVTGVTLLLTQPHIFAEYVSPRWDIQVRTLFLLGSFGIFVQALYFHTLFRQDASGWALRMLFGVMILLVSLALLVPAKTFPALSGATTIFVALSNLYTLILVVRAVVHRRAEARISLVGCIPLLVGAIHDISIFSQQVGAEAWVSVGLFLFTLVQSYLLSARFSNAFRQTEILGENLRQSEEKYRTLFEDSKDLVFMTALDGRIESVNPACFDVLGYSRDEVLNFNALDLYSNPAERLGFQAALAQAGAVADFPVTLRHKNGHELACQVTATVRHDKTGQTIGYQGIIHDMTAYKQTEAHRQRVLALQELNQSLEQRVETRTIALTEASTALQAEIEQRQSHQQEKDRLLALAQQQSEHLAAMSNWLMEMQKVQHQNQASLLDEDIQQKMADMRQNLRALQAIAGFKENLNLATYASDTIRLLTEIEIYMEQVTTSLDESNPSEDPLTGNPLLQLSSRERQVLKLMAEGKSNPEIASILTIRLNTVHTYLKRIRHKLDIQDIAGLTAFARKNGLLD